VTLQPTAFSIAAAWDSCHAVPSDPGDGARSGTGEQSEAEMKSGESRSYLTPVELASLDLMITAAQVKGVRLDDVLSDDDEEQAQAQADRVMAMWDARHGGIEFSDHDREVLTQIRELAATLETKVTLGQLVELRAEAMRNASG
jgi:hypothetical protein